MDLGNRGHQRAGFSLQSNSAKNNFIAVVQRGDMLGIIFFLSITGGKGALGRGGTEMRGGGAQFVIQSHPDSKLFEVLSGEIGFDHVALMNPESREGRRQSGSVLLLPLILPV